MQTPFGTVSRVIVLAALLGAAAAAHVFLAERFAPPPVPVEPKRIVSLAPSVTETLYALGLGPSVVGVTSFCSYPPDAAGKPRVAGFSNVNYEALLRVRPDLVALPEDLTAIRARLAQLGLPVLTLDTRSLAGLMHTLEVLGKASGRPEEARALVDAIHRGIEEAKTRAVGRAKPTVLFSVMHAYEGVGRIMEINAIGKDGFYDQLVAIAGGENVYTGNLAFPRLSREAIMYLNPDVVIDVVPPYVDIASVRRDWEELSSVSAIHNGRLHIFADVADTVPGPRCVQTLAKLSRAFHPDGDGK